MVKTVKIQDEYYDLIKDTADQLDTTIKEVVESILDWFFSQKELLRFGGLISASQ